MPIKRLYFLLAIIKHKTPPKKNNSSVSKPSTSNKTACSF